jgi:hypothetical protein
MVNLGTVGNGGRVPRPRLDVATWSPQRPHGQLCRRAKLLTDAGQNFRAAESITWPGTLPPRNCKRGDLRSMHATGEGDVEY